VLAAYPGFSFEWNPASGGQGEAPNENGKGKNLVDDMKNKGINPANKNTPDAASEKPDEEPQPKPKPKLDPILQQGVERQNAADIRKTYALLKMNYGKEYADEWAVRSNYNIKDMEITPVNKKPPAAAPAVKRKAPPAVEPHRRGQYGR
jgi:hypothetical protein